jgi:hypothetical protein
MLAPTLLFHAVGKLLLLSVVINIIALPVLTARGANTHRSLARSIALMLAFNVWCCARKGRSVSSPVPGGRSPATECTAVASSASSNVSGRRISGTRHHRLSCAAWPDQEEIVAAGGGDFEGATSEQLSANVPEIGDARRLFRARPDRGRRRNCRPVECEHGLRQRCSSA